MPYLMSCTEWQLLQNLAQLLAERKTRYVVHSEQDGSKQVSGKIYYGGEPQVHYELFDFELRKTFLLGRYTSSLNLSDSTFIPTKARLVDLCRVLDGLVQPEFSSTAQLDSKEYPNLESLLKYLKKKESEGSTEMFSLVGSENISIFQLPNNTTILKEKRRIVMQCNDFIDQLFTTNNREEPSTIKRKPKSQAWEDTRVRDQAANIFHLLFGLLKCQSQHEFMLRISQYSERDSIVQPLLNLWFLCTGAESKHWQEVVCDPSHGSHHIDSTADLCWNLLQYAGHGKAVHLSIQQREALSSLEGIQLGQISSATPPSKSLHHLISSGAFNPPDLSMIWKERSRSTPAHFNTNQKRALAVKLGYCLMDFFDSSINSENINFPLSENKPIQRELPYLRFTSGIPTSVEFRQFRTGHPVLMSFAKLLLEIDSGTEIPIVISSSYDGRENCHLWADLLRYAEKLEEYRIDSYVEAVKGCLMVHTNIRQALWNSDLDEKETDLIIRKELYVKVVQHLESAWEESIPRPSNKRSREESPPRQSWIPVEPQIGRRGVASTLVDVDINPHRQVSTKRLRTADPTETAAIERPPAITHRPKSTSGYLENSEAPITSSPGSSSSPGKSSTVFEGMNSPTEGQNGTETRQYDFCHIGDVFEVNEEVVVDAEKKRRAIDWFRYHEITLSKINQFQKARQLPSDPDTKRIKVAILDSGIQLSKDHDTKYNSESKFTYRSWVDSNPEDQDDIIGHGTHLAILLRKIAPRAAVYIARVFTKKPSYQGAAEKIAEAIMYAVDEWKVDIIVMAFGFGERNGILSDAIKHADFNNVLMFAAASNDGKNRPDGIAWPASDHRVICVHSADGYGNPSGFTPSAQDNMRFMVLGEHVISAWPEKFKYPGNLKHMSGTSCAAPIAAGIAAVFLDYSRSFLSDREWKEFHSIGSIRRMFEHFGRPDDISNGTKYRWIRHWNLFAQHSKVGEEWIHGEIRRFF